MIIAREGNTKWPKYWPTSRINRNMVIESQSGGGIHLTRCDIFQRYIRYNAASKREETRELQILNLQYIYQELFDLFQSKETLLPENIVEADTALFLELRDRLDDEVEAYRAGTIDKIEFKFIFSGFQFLTYLREN